uniref:NR LBD domain-containing protein n=1 Tax=Heligmosomoides polygyrus TaxID=6339 RepID=A0A183FYQ9_HELPZ
LNPSLSDEVSLPLLESGLARFSTLQAVLPTMLSFDASSDEALQRSRKLLRISQLEIEYLLVKHKILGSKNERLSSEALASAPLPSCLLPF